MKYIEPLKCIKIQSEDSKDMDNYDFVEFKYPGEWCVLHSNGRNCTLESKDGVILKDKMTLKADLVGHYWKFKNKNIFTYFDVITINNQNLTYKTFEERRKSFSKLIRYNSDCVPNWLKTPKTNLISRWKSMWLEKVLVRYRGVDFPGLVFKKRESKYGEGVAVLNKTI